MFIEEWLQLKGPRAIKRGPFLLQDPRFPLRAHQFPLRALGPSYGALLIVKLSVTVRGL